ncbi:DUF488 family protein [Emticicia oligotrophica]|uniref:DUF488 domain-containing protein n=1 Tax=Emticicia oligotrophica TaxID=312279 RepID=UPI00273BCCDA|nr:DUF488 domain-containing protein [Emticicia oligotrophica]
MKKKSLYTIGHGNRKQEDFLALLKDFGIEYLIDVRSQPYSKFNPQFNQNDLKFFLERNGIKYVFMGDTIGGRPKDTSCYDNEGKVDYETVKTKEFFLDGIKRLKTAYNKGINVVLMCSESKPCECHRSKLIGKVLIKDNINLNHIDEKGKLKDQSTVINELNKGLSEYDLFGNPINSTSRKAYI